MDFEGFGKSLSAPPPNSLRKEKIKQIEYG